MAIHVIMETIAAAFAPGGAAVFSFQAEADRNVNRWTTRAFRPAIARSIIFNQKVGSLPSVAALVMKSIMPDGTTSNKPLTDQESKCLANTETDRFLEKPSKRRSNIIAGPTSKTIPVICTISRPGYSHIDWRMAPAQELSSNH